MSEFLSNPKTILAALLIVGSVVTDLRRKKVPNQLIVIGLALALILIAVVEGSSGIWPAAASLGTATLFAFPLYSLRAIGAGDMKLIWVLSLLLNWNVVITMILASMLWGALLGVFRVLLQGKGKAFAKNLLAILKKSKPQPSQMTQVPYTIAIFFGFLTSLSLNSVGISWV